MLFRFLFALLLILNIKNVQADQISSEEIDKEIDFIYRSQFPESEMLITQIRLRTWPILSDALTVYKSNQDLFLPIAEFSKALDFPIYISDKEKVASGWFINENQKFYLNLVTGVVEVNGKKYLIGSVSTPTDYDISQDNIKIIDGDIYANSKLLEKWFDLKIVFDPLDQLVQIDSAQPLPIEERVDRDRKWDEFNKNEEINNQSAEDENLETIRTPFKLISTPLTDVRLKQDISKTANGNNAINQVDLLVSGDALHLNHKLFASVTNGSLSSARLTSGQRDPDGKLLGPLKATEFSFGDVFTPETPLVARTVSGKGAVVTNYPQEYVSDFNTVPIIGNIQPGWDVELYRNDSLIGFKRAGKEGFYEFLNVPLMTGMNIVKLVFYGPFGQRRVPAVFD